MITPDQLEEARTLFYAFHRDAERSFKRYSDEAGSIHKAVRHFIEMVFADPEILSTYDKELNSKSVNDVFDVFKEELSRKEPIHGNFYNDIRQRYFSILDVEPDCSSSHQTRDEHLAWMLTKLSDDDMSDTKKHRWLGYIQGCMVMKGYLSVEYERNATRPIFNGK